MKNRYLLSWLILGALGLGLFLWAFPRAFPTLPQHWTLARDGAQALALEKFRDLGEPVANAYVETSFQPDYALDRRLQLEGAPPPGAPGTSDVAEANLKWQVRVYAPGAKPADWTYRAEISTSGRVLSLEKKLPKEASGGEISPENARAAADRFLSSQGFDLARFGEPEQRAVQLESRTDRTLTYREKGTVLGASVPYGLRVSFAGDQLTGFASWHEDPEAEQFNKAFQPLVLANFLWRVVPLLLVPLIGFFFLRRYHEGEVGVRRGLQILAGMLGMALVFMVMVAQVASAGWDFGILARRQVTWITGIQISIFYFFPMAVIAFLAWSVGEALCRERYPRRLAGFDGLWQGKWGNATVARDSLRGLVLGVWLTALQVLPLLLLRPLGVWTPTSSLFGPWYDGIRWLGLGMVLYLVVTALYSELFGRLLIFSAFEARMNRWLAGALTLLLGLVLFYPAVTLVPMSLGFALAALCGLVLLLAFLRYGLLTSLTANLASGLFLSAYPYLLTQDRWQQSQAALALLLPGLPLLLSLRHLASDKEFVYRYEDVPPHVRRIAERERQRVELETARRIQSSILPELPPSLNGVELAYSYLPASEVGGDFYDVLALEDGRLAVAVGDVAGHGVSSGLVMSMARSALAVQVTFNPEVEAVLATLNRVVHQSARKRLLATLCYAVLDPQRRELLYASAGHLYPYLVSQDGKVHPLEYDAYPLGVRPQIEVAARSTRLAPGDTLFLLSDGLVEARPEGSDDLFGFPRLEASLRRAAHLPVSKLRDAVLADVAAHTGNAPREDDQTVLVLRVP